MANVDFLNKIPNSGKWTEIATRLNANLEQIVADILYLKQQTGDDPTAEGRYDAVIQNMGEALNRLDVLATVDNNGQMSSQYVKWLVDAREMAIQNSAASFSEIINQQLPPQSSTAAGHVVYNSYDNKFAWYAIGRGYFPTNPNEPITGTSPRNGHIYVYNGIPVIYDGERFQEFLNVVKTQSGGFTLGESHTNTSKNSFVGGARNSCIGNCGFGYGEGLAMNNGNESAFGSYNASHNQGTPQTKTRQSLGIGDGDKNRKNAYEVMGDGAFHLIGSNGYNGKNPTAGNTLQALVNKLTPILLDAVIETTPCSDRTYEEMNGRYVFSTNEKVIVVYDGADYYKKATHYPLAGTRPIDGQLYVSDMDQGLVLIGSRGDLMPLSNELAELVNRQNTSIENINNRLNGVKIVIKP